MKAHRKLRRAVWTLPATLALTAACTVGYVAGESSASSGSAALAAASAPKLTIPKGWKVKFDAATFKGTKLNTKVWATCYWWANPAVGCTNYGNAASDPEDEWYLAAQDQVRDGVLRLAAQQKPTKGTNAKGKPKTYSCRSGLVSSAPAVDFEYGIISVTAHIPYNTGLWSALWLAASNHAWPPEVDIVEHWNSDKQAKVYLHPAKGPRQGGAVYPPGNLARGWHSFTLYWTKARMTWYIDGTQVFTTTKGIPHQKMYLIANLADDSNAKGACTGTMLIRAVKVWQP